MDIKLILLDVDGVLTDGSILVDGDGNETKRFNVKDGLAIKAAQSVGVPVGIISARHSRATARRARELDIDIVEQASKDKAAAMRAIVKNMKIKPASVVFIGDDLADIGVMKAVGYPIAVADAAEPVRQIAKYVTKQPGGRGAVREAIEHVLNQADLWAQVLARYESA
jgi:3-deoxy-D-manno-octulosonate 8-phosphate phosphatase (KDO 8-P phosphatase)